MEFATEIARRRSKIFKSPRSFYTHAKLDCSYFQYLRIEQGKAIPSAQIALEILDHLEIDRYAGLALWVRDQLEETDKDIFPQVDIKPEDRPPAPTYTPSESTTVVNRMQLELLNEDTIYWELLTYLNVYEHNPVKLTIHEITKEFGLPQELISARLEKLYKWGLINLDNDLYIAGEWVHVPFSEEFTALRDRNLRNALARFWESPRTSRFRTTHSRSLSKRQHEIYMTHMKNMLHKISQLPDEKDGIAYTLGVFSYQRVFNQYENTLPNIDIENKKQGPSSEICS